MVSNSLVVDTKNTAYSGVLIIGREEGIRIKLKDNDLKRNYFSNS